MTAVHEHAHDHPHDHPHVLDPENPHAGQGMVLLDIGGDVGALVVTMPEAMLGQEVEIRPEGAGDDHHPHAAVHARPVPGGGRMASLVYPSLDTGSYELYVLGTHDVRLRVDVRGGEVTTAAWPS